MPVPHSIADAASGKPAKPSPAFPLFPHATRRWAKKIKGKTYYFGSWDDPDAALREYQAFVAGEEREKPRRSNSAKPAKPYPDFPLYAHAGGVWAKRIRGKLYYFGPWDDSDGALASYLAQKDDLHAGRKPREQTEGTTVKELCNDFLNQKKALVDAGELSPRTWTDYKEACVEVMGAFSKGRLVADLRPDDFAALRKQLAKKWGPHRLGKTIQCVRCTFKHAYEAGLIATPIRFGPGFKRPSKKVLRVHRAEQGPKLFTAGEVRRMIDTAGLSMQAMILLGINCGFGNSDCGNLPLSAVDLDNAIIDFARPKTGIARRCPLWPETVAAIRAVRDKRPTPKSEEDAALVFLTKYGDSWAKDVADSPITKEMRKLLNRLGFNGHRNFYTLRHTFRTVADESKDQPAVDFCMGHEVPHMSVVYRETISDARLRAVADHVRRWLFPSTAFAKSATEVQ
jgi:integrase